MLILLRIFSFALLLSSISLEAQNQHDFISPYWTINEVSGFPVFSGPDKSASLKINYYLQSTMLNKLLNEGGNPFDALLYQQTFQEYNVFRNDSQCLSIGFNWEGCGAYCENFDVYFTFNSGTGDLLLAEDLFTKKGYHEVKQMITAERQQSLSQEIASEKDQLKRIREGDSQNSDDSVRLLEQIDMYEDCLARRDSSEIQYDKIYLSDSAVWFAAERCSNHAMRAIDDLYDFFNAMPVFNHMNVLSEYGKQFFGLTFARITPKQRFTVYEGTINGKYPILFFEDLGAEGNQYSYCYKKYGTMITLETTSKENGVLLEEKDREGNTTGSLQFTKKGNKLSGTYFNSDSEKTMSFEVTQKF